MLLSYKNPCQVVCLFEPHQNLGFGFLDEEEEEICGKFRRQFSNISRTILIRDTQQQCGPNHVIITEILKPNSILDNKYFVTVL